MNTYDLYGYDYDNNIESARQAVEGALSIILNAHESSYLGDYYRLGSTGAENFILQHNYDEFEKEWMEENFHNYPLLLYVNGTSRAKEL